MDPRDAPARAPNRPLELTELEDDRYRAVLRSMDELLARQPRAYLHPGKRWEYPWALERARLDSSAKVLDAGCGESVFPLYLASRGHSVTALDRALGSRLGSGLTPRPPDYVAGLLDALPFRESTFDAVFCISVIEHLPEQAIPAALEDLRRVLCPGGRLVLTTDYYHDAEAEIWHDGPERRFRVDWSVFDRTRLERLILSAPGLRVDGAVDLEVDWERVEPRMQAFHGYPYTSVGVALIRE